MSEVNESLINLAKSYVEKVRETNIVVDSAYLFGSFVRGNSHPGSDLDVAIISPSFGKNSFDERLTLMRIDTDPSSLIEPHPFSPEDMEEKYNFLAQEVKKGIRIA